MTLFNKSSTVIDRNAVGIFKPCLKPQENLIHGKCCGWTLRINAATFSASFNTRMIFSLIIPSKHAMVTPRLRKVFCLGRETAWIQAKMFITKVLWTFDVVDVPGQHLDLERNLLHYGFFAKPELRVTFMLMSRGGEEWKGRCYIYHQLSTIALVKITGVALEPRDYKMNAAINSAGRHS